MLRKNPRTFIRKLLIRGGTVLFVVEGLAFVGSYGVWHKLNSERDFRFYMYNNFPKILNIYYTLDDKFGEGEIRKVDYKYWDLTKKI